MGGVPKNCAFWSLGAWGTDQASGRGPWERGPGFRPSEGLVGGGGVGQGRTGGRRAFGLLPAAERSLWLGGGCCSFSSYGRIHGSDKDQFPGSIDCRLIGDSMCFEGLAIVQAGAKTCTVSSN